MKYEITSKKEFQIEAAKALLADGQPHSYAEIVQHIRSQAEGTVLEGRIDYGNVWYSLRSMMEEPGSHYQKAGWGAYQKDPPQRITAEPSQDAKDGQSEIYQIMDQAVELLERFESYSSRVQGELNLTSGQETFTANPRMEELMTHLADRLRFTSGKKQYGYLKAPLKAVVDEIVDELAKDPRVTNAYDLWYQMREEVLRTYILSAFAHKKLIYESRELSKDKMKEYRNAVFVGFDEHGVARHAHKRSLYSKGKSYRGNVAGSDPRYSFHWTGTSNQLYVFEAPIDLLAFLSLHPTGWKSHSYVALCGTGEQAMLWMLKQSPALQEIILCLDHDAAGIEATGRLTDILREQGYSQITTMQSLYKDWDEDLKAQHNLPAQPSEEHPQLLAAESVCARIAMKCVGNQPDRVPQRLPALFQFYRTCMEGNKLETAMDCIEEIAAMSLQVVLRECRQLGTDLTIAQGGQFLQSRILPHQNRGNLKSRTEEISTLIRRAVDQSSAPGIRGEAEKRAIAGAWLDLAIACAKVSVKQDADERKLMHTAEPTPSGQEQSMQAV